MIVGCSNVPSTAPTLVYAPCEVPERPVLPDIPVERLDTLDDATYWELEERERRIVDWALEMEAVLEVVCQS